MKKLLLCCGLCMGALHAQQPAAPAAAPAKDFSTQWYGFIRTDYAADTRKMAQVREYNLDLYPLDVALDPNGADINKVGAYNYLPELNLPPNTSVQ